MMKMQYRVVWDPNKDHDVKARCETLSGFYAVLLEQVNQGFLDIAFSPKVRTAEQFDIICKMIWPLLDGDRTTVFVVEEAADIQRTVGKDVDTIGTLIREGRKYGLIVLATSQRGPEISKTLLTQSGHLWIGKHSRKDAKYAGDLIGKTADEIHSLKKGQWWHYDLEADTLDLVNIQ